MTDDQMPSTLPHMQAVRRKIIAQGKTFKNTVNAFPVCCPSRAIIQRGQYGHNTGVLSNVYPWGGFGRFEEQGLEQSTVAIWLQGAGYTTGYFGRYMNQYQGDERTPDGRGSTPGTRSKRGARARARLAGGADR